MKSAILRSRAHGTASPFRAASMLAFLAVTLVAWTYCAQPITAARKHPSAKPLDLNTATLDQLEQLPGIGPSTAKAIIEFREKSGPFQRVDDLLAIRRISRARLEKLRPYLTVVPPHEKPNSSVQSNNPLAPVGDRYC